MQNNSCLRKWHLIKQYFLWITLIIQLIGFQNQNGCNWRKAQKINNTLNVSSNLFNNKSWQHFSEFGKKITWLLFLLKLIRFLLLCAFSHHWVISLGKWIFWSENIETVRETGEDLWMSSIWIPGRPWQRNKISIPKLRDMYLMDRQLRNKELSAWLCPVSCGQQLHQRPMFDPAQFHISEPSVGVGWDLKGQAGTWWRESRGGWWGWS